VSVSLAATLLALAVVIFVLERRSRVTRNRRLGQTDDS
jgi:hypothetical protein